MKQFSFLLLLFLSAPCLLLAQDKVKYDWHDGVAVLKTDLQIKGSFKYLPANNGVPYFMVKDNELDGVQKIPVVMFRTLTLAGAERGVSSKKDTSEFVWVDGFDDLLRIVRKGKLTVYDNSKIINEQYKSLPNYTMAVANNQGEINGLRKVKNLMQVMSDQPYFMEVARATGRYESRDFRVIMYLVDLYNMDNPMKYLNWKPMKITARGKVYTGKGFLQPMDFRNEFSIDTKAYVHFYDGKDFELFNHQEISAVECDGETYEQGFYGLSDKHFFGKEWTYEGQTYIVIERIVNRNNFFFKSKEEAPLNYVILQKVRGSFIRVGDEMNLRRAYFKE